MAARGMLRAPCKVLPLTGRCTDVWLVHSKIYDSPTIFFPLSADDVLHSFCLSLTQSPELLLSGVHNTENDKRSVHVIGVWRVFLPGTRGEFVRD